MKVPVLSSLILFYARQAGGGYHSLLASGEGPRTHTGEDAVERKTNPAASQHGLCLKLNFNGVSVTLVVTDVPHIPVFNQDVQGSPLVVLVQAEGSVLSSYIGVPVQIVRLSLQLFFFTKLAKTQKTE